MIKSDIKEGKIFKKSNPNNIFIQKIVALAQKVRIQRALLLFTMEACTQDL